MYLEKFQGKSFSRKYKENRPTIEVFSDVMYILDGGPAKNIENPVERDSAMTKYMSIRYEVLGMTSLKEAPTEYYDIGTIVGLGWELEEWKSFSIHSRAKILARLRLKNMTEIIDAYYKHQDDAKAKQEKDAEAKAKQMRRK